MPRKAGSKTRTGWERSKTRFLLNQQRLLLRQRETSVDLINQQRAAGLFVLVRIRLFVWLSVSEFLLVVPLRRLQAREGFPHPVGPSTPGSPAGVCGSTTVLFGQGLSPLVLGRILHSYLGGMASRVPTLLLPPC